MFKRNAYDSAAASVAGASVGASSVTGASVGTAVVLTTTTTDVTNCGVPDGTATVTVTASNGTPLTYLWDDASAQTSTTATALSAGVYVVTVTDGWGCSATANDTVANSSGFSITEDGFTNVTCNGLTDGDITVTTVGGVAPFTYSWSDGTVEVGTNEDLTGVGAGTYTLTANDGAGCSVTSSAITITEPDVISVTLDSYLDVICNGGTNGEVNVTATGGTGVLSYGWSDGTAVVGTNEDLSGVGAGTYVFAVTDENTCTPATLTQVITQPTAIAITVDSQENPKCYLGTDGNIFVTVTGGTPTYSYSWSDGTSVVGTDEDLSGVGEGDYTLTVTDSVSCTHSSMTVSLVNPEMLSVNVSATNETSALNDGTATAVASGGTPIYTYVWTPSGQTTATATDLSPGTYTCLVKDDNGCTVNSNEVEILQFVSINDVNLSDFVIYPNPSNGVFTVQFETSETVDFEISLVNTIGKKIFTNTYNNVNGIFSEQFNNDITNGIYFLEISTKEGISVIKITVNK